MTYDDLERKRADARERKMRQRRREGVRPMEEFRALQRSQSKNASAHEAALSQNAARKEAVKQANAKWWKQAKDEATKLGISVYELRRRRGQQVPARGARKVAKVLPAPHREPPAVSEPNRELLDEIAAIRRELRVIRRECRRRGWRSRRRL